MDNLARLKIAKPDIEGYFDNIPQKVFLKKDLGRILSENQKLWRLTKSIYTDRFVDLMKKVTKLREISLVAPNYDKTLVRYVWGKDASIYQLALSIKPKSYFTHYTAMFLHNLTQQIPKTIYMNTEQSKKPLGSSNLEQKRIDMAFEGKDRVSKYVFHYENWKICCISGKNTDNLGVEDLKVSDGDVLPVSNIERTLIDISVRPVYSGGVYEVLNAYKEAKGKFSTNKLLAMLKKINYIYPYHQVIGFYMERAGYDDAILNLFLKMDMNYDFYLDHGMKDADYSKKWRLFFPKNF